ncbi:chemotaxis protein CheB [Flavobacterium sp. SE-1-e]|uniref:protein-glutamate methylesterase n=2 Tax=Flavobacterium agrisoli TaxID=2793066 RepID=A0A934PLA1_9FLAO|nr:chemotaxis protein CheB [Flavobacterium agrisoli]
MEKDKMRRRCKLLIIGGSAGSLQVLINILPKIVLPIPFAIVVVVHRKNTYDTILEDLIALKTMIPVEYVEDKTVLAPGIIYVAPSDYHLLFEDKNTLSLDGSEKVNYSRPSIDVSFESAALIFKQELVAILLSGANADGTKGMQTIQEEGGVTIVQRPETAEIPYMPEYAIQNSNPDFIFTEDEIVNFVNSTIQ